MVKARELDALLDQMKIPKGKARSAAKSYCSAKINSSEGQCLPSEELNSWLEAITMAMPRVLEADDPSVNIG